jgi:7-alpha-hydroxysteroid dehydrogenase
MSFSIAGKTAVVTGAANGVGLAIARHFQERDANVIFADMDEKKLTREVGEDLGDDSPIRCFAGDLRQKLTCANLLSFAIDAYDRVDILVNASRQVMTGDPLDPDDNTVSTLIEQNLITALRLTQLFAKRMISQAEKEVDQMTRSMAVALAPQRIRVNAVAFGSVMSASLQGALKENNDLREDIIDHTPLARIAKAHEVAEVVQFLASDGAGFMTGQILTVDGGRTLIDAVGTSAH